MLKLFYHGLPSHVSIYTYCRPLYHLTKLLILLQTILLALTISLTTQTQALPLSSPENPTTQQSRRDLRIQSTTHLGDVTSLTTSVVRDLGFAGQIGPYVLLSFGDTLFTNKSTHPSNPAKDPTQFLGMTSNSVALATHDPLRVVDPVLNAQGWPEQFVPVNKAWSEDMATHSVGITNVIDITPSEGSSVYTGLVFTLLNHRPGGVNDIQGAGLATVTIDPSHDPPKPCATRHHPTLWTKEEPWFGDVGAIRTSTHLYAYGHHPSNPWVYLARTPLPQSSSQLQIPPLHVWEYWHGASTGWSPTRLLPNTTTTIDETQSIFWQVNQGQVIYSPYLSQFLFVYCDNFWSSRILMRTSPLPEGPWGMEVEVCKVTPVKEGGTIYAAAPWAHLDPSGKSLVVAFTNHPNCVQGVRVVFE